MKNLIVNNPSGKREIVTVSETGGYYDDARILWDERTDGELTPAQISAVESERQRETIVLEVKQKARSVRDGGTTINGIFVSTDGEARSLLTGAKVHPKASRKIVARGGRAIVDEATYNAIVQGVSDFIQAVFDREYDLLEQIDAASDAELKNIDIKSGWPA